MEQLCQIQILASAGATPATAFYATNLNGRYNAKVVGITWTDDTAVGDHRLIQIQSNCFRIPYGTKASSISFGNKGDHSQGNPGGHFPFLLEVMGGGIDLTIIPSSAYNGGGNNSFFFCILTLVVEKIE